MVVVVVVGGGRAPALSTLCLGSTMGCRAKGVVRTEEEEEEELTMFFGGGAAGRVLKHAATGVLISIVPAGRQVARFCGGMVVAVGRSVGVPVHAAAPDTKLPPRTLCLSVSVLADFELGKPLISGSNLSR